MHETELLSGFRETNAYARQCFWRAIDLLSRGKESEYAIVKAEGDRAQGRADEILRRLKVCKSAPVR